MANTNRFWDDSQPTSQRRGLTTPLRISESSEYLTSSFSPNFVIFSIRSGRIHLIFSLLIEKSNLTIMNRFLNHFSGIFWDFLLVCDGWESNGVKSKLSLDMRVRRHPFLHPSWFVKRKRMKICEIYSVGYCNILVVLPFFILQQILTSFFPPERPFIPQRPAKPQKTL